MDSYNVRLVVSIIEDVLFESMSDFRTHAQTAADTDRGQHGFICEVFHHIWSHLTSC